MFCFSRCCINMSYSSNFFFHFMFIKLRIYRMQCALGTADFNTKEQITARKMYFTLKNFWWTLMIGAEKMAPRIYQRSNINFGTFTDLSPDQQVFTTLYIHNPSRFVLLENETHTQREKEHNTQILYRISLHYFDTTDTNKVGPLFIFSYFLLL